MKRFFTLFLVLFCLSANGQIITEIMYNSPESGVDSLEYIEMYNNTGDDINLENYSILGVFHKFEAMIFPADSYLVVAKNAAAISAVFQTPAVEWNQGALNNMGEEVAILTPDSVAISSILFSNNTPWPENANGLGYSLELCNLSANVSNPSNWGISTFNTGVEINNRIVFGSPGKQNEADCSEEPEEYLNVAINEIMYDAIGATDSLEYIEILNYGSDTVSLAGWDIDGDVTYTLPTMDLLPNRTIVLSKNKEAFFIAYGKESYEWAGTQRLADDAGMIRLFNNTGTLIDEVNYSSEAPWPTITPGTSVTLCELFGDHDDGTNWIASENLISIPGIGETYGSPGRLNLCDNQTIGEITEIDAEGILIRLGDTITTFGTVHGPNFNPSGLSFTIIDEANDGIAVFEFDNPFGYEVTEGDNITVTGVLGQFNGLAQIRPSSITINSTSSPLQDPTVTFRLNEDTESQLVKLEDMYILDTEDWTNQGSGFNVDISNGVDTVVMRIDADISSIFGLNYPTGTFDVTGIGGQFDNSSPYDGGYQVFPRYLIDISPFNEFMPDTMAIDEEYPIRTIKEMTNSDAEGVADSLDIKCTLEGVVHGVNFSGSDLIMTIIDSENNGIGIFNNDNTVGYVVQEGDMVRLKGTIGQFNGLTQILTDSLEILSIGNDLVSPLVYDSNIDMAFLEANESSLIRLEDVTVVDPSEWAGDGSSFNMELTSANMPGVSFTMRIDNDTEIANTPYPFEAGDVLSITGLQGQFDSSSPYDSGYQILPRYLADLNVEQDTTPVINDEYPLRTIVEMTNVDAEGVADSLDIKCTLEGIVYGVNLSGSDLIMTIIDENNNGIGVFNNDNTVGYEVVEGDMVSLKGTISQFNGLTQIRTDSLEILSTGNDLVTPLTYDITTGGFIEENESSLIKFDIVNLVDPSQWLGDGSSFNVDFVFANDPSLGTFTMRIDNDTELSSMPFPLAGTDGLFITGIQGQFDSSSPFDSGYQILPRFTDDFDWLIDVIDVVDIDFDNQINIYPNPTQSILQVNSDIGIDDYKVFNNLGQLVLSNKYENEIDISNLPEGSYSILFRSGEKLSNKKFIKIK